MTVISVITPIYAPEPAHLRAAYESLAKQDLPAGSEWEWIVQEDGTTGIAEEILPTGDQRIKFGRGRHNGVAIARNLGVARAAGTLIKNLDQDDVLTDGVLARDLAVHDSRPEVGWTTSRVLDLMPDGSTAGFEGDPPEGVLQPPFVFEHWRTRNYRLPVHPTTICIRRQLLTALGGWMAVPGSDDTGMLVAASMVSVGYFHGDVGLLYRKWPGQVTAGAAHREPVEWTLRMRLIEERAESLRAFGVQMGS